MSSPQNSPPAAPAPTEMTASDQRDKLKTAFAMHQQGQLDQAEALYTEILAAQADHYDVLQLLATIATQRKDYARAVTLCEQSLAINAQQANVHNVLGLALSKMNRFLAALESYERALQLQPDHVDAHNNRANVLRDLGRLEEALQSYEQALCLQPDHAEILHNRGVILNDLKRFEAALESCDRVLQLQPNHAGAHYNRGFALGELKRFEPALRSFEQAVLLDPNDAIIHTNHGNVLRNLKRHQQALYSYERALQLWPDYPEILNNLGLTLIDLGQPTQALQRYQQALLIKPDHAEIHLNEGLCRLQLGDFAAGWQKFEWRWKTDHLMHLARVFAQPLWLGQEDLQDKTILLYAEQGLGDTIQFCRYVAQVAALGATVILEVPASLKSLLRDLDGVALLLCHGDPLPAFDYQCPLMSLPLAFQTHEATISDLSYLYSDPEKRAPWQAKLNKNNKKRVGLVWRGNPAHQHDADRSIPIDQLLDQLTENEHIDYYCLQKELLPAEMALLEQRQGMRFFGDELLDFSDTAALLDLMDLVLTVDTSVAHLAGAMGKPVWILLPFNPDWRWQLERSDSPWYQSARLLRQPDHGDWRSILTQLDVALKTPA